MFAQIDLTGFWKVSVPDGGTTYFDLHQSGDALTGTITTGGALRAVSGSAGNGQFHLANGRPTGGAPARGAYEGSLQGNSIVLTAPVKAALTPTTREEMYPPRLPLPELQDVPDNGLVRTPPMGWNSWNHFRTQIDDATIRAEADAMASSGMAKAGYSYIVIDDGWAGPRGADGRLTGNRRFPDLKALGDYIHSKGLKFGMYTSPGPRSCGGYEGSYGHEELDAQTFAAWGVDYLKYDWCSTAIIYGSTREESQAITQKMGEALLNSGRPIVYSVHSMGEVWRWAASAGANLWRTTNDIADNWASLERTGFSQLDIAHYGRPGHWNDPDMLEIGNGGMTAEEYRTHLSLWALLSAPLMAGNDLRSMTEETKEILTNAEVIAIDQDRDARPVERVAEEGATEVWVRPLRDTQTPRFGVAHAVAVGLFNRGDKPAEVSVRWDQLPVGAVLGAKALHARDVWRHADVTVTGGGYTVVVAPHGVVLLRVTATPTR